MSSRSIAWSKRTASFSDMPGGAVGIYKRTPSFSGGMNSLFSRKSAGAVKIMASSAAITT